MPLTDCYVLAPFRSALLASRFPDAFVPDREPSIKSADPHEVLGISPDLSFDELITGLSLDEIAEYTFDWRSTRPTEPQHAMLAFNQDGSLVLGLSIDVPDDLCESDMTTIMEIWIERLRDFVRDCRTPFGDSPQPIKSVWGSELPPPAAAADFDGV